MSRTTPALSVEEARRTLGTRPGACRAEVERAFRTMVKHHRPDLGRVDGEWMSRVRLAREVAIADAGPDRRRHPRLGRVLDACQVLAMRSSTWSPSPSPKQSTFDTVV